MACNTAGQDLIVNAYRFGLSSIQFAVMIVLVCHAIRLAGKEVPLKVELKPYLSAKDILAAIEAHPGNGALLARCQNWTSDDIIRAVYGIRQKLKKELINPFLVDRGTNKRGYRLGTAPQHVTLTYLYERTGRVMVVTGKRRM